MSPCYKPPWVNGEPLPGVAFAYNSIIQIISGEHAGETGWLVGVELGPDPVYTVELTSGEGDIDVPQSLLRAMPK